MPNTQDKQSTGFKRMTVVLSAVLIALIIIIILLLLRSCNGTDDPNAIPPYAPVDTEPNATPVESDPAVTRPEVSPGGGSLSMVFGDTITYSLSTGELTLLYQNPPDSTHDIMVRVVVVNGDEEYILAESGRILIGYGVQKLTKAENAPKLSVGKYNGVLRLFPYDPETGELAIVNTDIPVTITVTE